MLTSRLRSTASCCNTLSRRTVVQNIGLLAREKVANIPRAFHTQNHIRHEAVEGSEANSHNSASAFQSGAPSTVGGPEAKDETVAVRALDRLSSALRVKQAANERTHTLSRIRGGGFWADRHLHPGTQSDTKAASGSEASTQAAPKERTMEDSYIEVNLPFESDSALLEKYIGAFTSVRVGRIMEDLDSLAGSIAYKHVMPDGANAREVASSGLYVVTAAVDRLDMLRPMSADEPEDLRLSGHVYSVGRSTMEITVRLQSVSKRRGLQDNPETILLGRFTMACRDKETGKAKAVPQLVTNGEDEEMLENLGKEQRDKKLAQMKKSLQVVPPEPAEAEMLHNIFTKFRDCYQGGRVPEEVVWMRKGTQLTSVLMCHPQERNVHGNVFGGYLMRLAYEAAYSTGCLFARAPIVFLALDELAFKAPVTVGSLLQLTTAVTFSPIQHYMEHKSFQVSVEAATIDLHTGEKRVTNIFHYTFSSAEPLKRFILPENYLDGLSWLESMRRREVGRQLRRLYNA